MFLYGYFSLREVTNEHQSEYVISIAIPFFSAIIISKPQQRNKPINWYAQILFIAADPYLQFTEFFIARRH
jgi:hypothetical protein